MLLDIHTHRTPPKGVYAIINQYPLTAEVENPFSVGIHPWYVSESDWEKQWNALEQIAQHENCKAIGECGLDKNVSLAFDLQKEIFRKHIALSERLQKPLIIHCVKAFDEIIAFRKKIKPTQTWILHGFRKNKAVAQSLINSKIALSFGKALLTDAKLQDVFRYIPEGFYFLETDDADVSISEIYQKAEEIKGKLVISLLGSRK